MLNQTEETFYDLIKRQLSKQDKLPLLNYTWLNQTLKEVEDGGTRFKESGIASHKKKERVSGRFFPRWNALSKVSNPKYPKQVTSAIMIAGDSKLENEIGVALGFPKAELKRSEVIVLQDVLDVLGLKEGDKVDI
jgi:hypothetical protein